MGFFRKVIDLIWKCGEAISSFFKTGVKQAFASPKSTIVTIVSSIAVGKAIKSKIDEFKLNRRIAKAKKRQETARIEYEERQLKSFNPSIKPNNDTKSKSYTRFSDGCKDQKKFGGPLIVLTEKQEEFLNRYIEEEANEAFKMMPKRQQIWLLEAMYDNLEEFEAHLQEVKHPKKTGLRNHLYYKYNLGAPKFRGMNAANDGYPSPFKETKSFKGFFGKYVVKPVDEIIYRMEVGYNKPEYPEDQYQMFTTEELALFKTTVITPKDIPDIIVEKVHCDNLAKVYESTKPRDIGIYYKNIRKDLKDLNITGVYIDDLTHEIKEFKKRKDKAKAQFNLTEWYEKFKNADGIDAKELVTLFTRERLFLNDPYGYNKSESTASYQYKEYDDMSKEEREKFINTRRFSRLLASVKLARENADFVMYNGLGEMYDLYNADEETIRSKDYLAVKRTKKKMKKKKKALEEAKGEYSHAGFNKAREELGINEKRARLMNQQEKDEEIERILDDSIYSKYREKERQQNDKLIVEKANNQPRRMNVDYDDDDDDRNDRYRIKNRDRNNRNRRHDDDDDYRDEKSKKKLNRFIEYERRSDYGEYDESLSKKKKKKKHRDEEYVY